MWTGTWWSEIQKKLPVGTTLVPLILSLDKTCLTNHSGNEEAWPVYLTIGNIPKSTRRHLSSRATVLVGYIPVSKLKCCTSGDARQQAEHWLFHTSMARITRSLRKAGSEGVHRQIGRKILGPYEDFGTATRLWRISKACIGIACTYISKNRVGFLTVV
ncbi:hypothetical protein BDV93DRAFT_458015 [Ceratobasidium sp. AG-I]|nr:hypothetical protein BDV93DRAFT_458015 [Ceratobasidium sp. AG-I]